MHIFRHMKKFTSIWLIVIFSFYGSSLCKSQFNTDLINPWRLPIVAEFNDGQVAVIEKVDAQGNVHAIDKPGLGVEIDFDLVRRETLEVLR